MNSIPDRLKAALADRYAIERELGHGGMATVYLALDRKHDRKVAVKVLRPELAAAMGPDRFLNEIRITATLQHPHILPLLDSGDAEGVLYYVMPYVEGESLREKMNREGRVPVRDALAITREVGAALDYAHRRDIIHRDIKPENILLHEGGAIVADFGVALAVSAAGGERLTGTGLAIGTPAYMSPEQITGDRDVDARTDLYALACMLYEMLTGGPTLTAESPQALIAKRITQPVPSARQHGAEIPADLDRAIARALERLPNDRFDTVATFLEACERAVAPRPARARAWEPGHVLPETESVQFRDEMVLHATELRLGVDYLETRDDIDTSRLAYVGLSWGAGSRLPLAVVDDRFRSVVLIGGGIDERVQPTLPEASNINFAPYIGVPTLLLNGRSDEEHPWYTRALPLWNLLSEPKKLVLVDGAGHVPPLEARVPAINEWLDETLGTVRMRR